MRGTVAALLYGLRRVVRAPAASLLAAATLAVAIGANTAVFSAVYASVLRPLPYPDPGRLVLVTSEFPGIRLKGMGLSPPEFVELQRMSPSLGDGGAVRFGTATLGGAEPRRIRVAYAGGGLMQALGTRPAAGRSLVAGDGLSLDGRVAVLSHRLWVQAWSRDPGILGRQIDIDGEGRTVVGVMPEGFDLLGSDTDLWLPLGLNPSAPGPRADHYLRVIARLPQQVTMADASRELHAAVARWMTATGELHSPSPDIHPLSVTPLQDAVTGELRSTMVVLQGAVGFVLLLACANVASLLAARAETARHQLAIRVALGASKRRIVADQLIEGLWLAAAGCAAGVLLAWALSTAIAASPFMRHRQEMRTDAVVLVFAVVASAVSGLLFGLAPVLRLDLRRAHRWLQSDARGTIGSGDRRRLHHAIIVVQVAVAVTLLAGAAALIQSFWRLARVDPGFRTHDVIAFEVSLPERRFRADEQVWTLYDRLLAALDTAPGVRSAAVMSGPLPQRRANNTTFVIDGMPVQGHMGMPQVEFVQHVTTGYFSTLGIRLLKGRLFDRTDTESAEPIALVNQTLARKFWGSADPLGRRMRPALPGVPWFRIAGVVSDVKHAGLAAPVGTEIYVPYRQARLLLPGWLPASMQVVSRVATERHAAFTRAVPAIVREVDRHVAISNLRPMTRAVDESIAAPAFLAILLSGFACVASLLAAVGIYGVVDYVAGERTGEFGVRVALGASPGNVLALVARQAAVPVLAGVLLGVAGSLATARLLTNFVFQVRPASPPLLLAVVGILSGVALLACWVPARRAMRVDPLAALRTL